MAAEERRDGKDLIAGVSKEERRVTCKGHTPFVVLSFVVERPFMLTA
jgi:hypothetical protein